MGIFDLVFLILFFISAATLLAAGWFAFCRQFDRPGRLLLRLLTGAAAYLLVVIAVSRILPRRDVKVGDLECFDDWCVSIAGFTRTAEGARVAYRVDVRLSSRARRVSQREKNLAVYMTDDRGRRYDPVADTSAVPFSVLLQPKESVVVSRSFLIPGDAADAGVVITHEGGFPMGWFIVGYDTWFRKPPIARLQ